MKKSHKPRDDDKHIRKLRRHLGSRRYQDRFEHALVLMQLVSEAPKHLRTKMMRLIYRHMGAYDLPITNAYIEPLMVTQSQIDSMDEHLAGAFQIRYQALLDMNPPLSLDQFCQQMDPFMSKYPDLEDQAFALAVAYDLKLIPYNYATVGETISKDQVDKVLKEELGTIRLITDAVEGRRIKFTGFDLGSYLYDLVHRPDNPLRERILLWFVVEATRSAMEDEADVLVEQAVEAVQEDRQKDRFLFVEEGFVTNIIGNA